jgi:pimeloyl-ACP methyl ester carboxylesterase
VGALCTRQSFVPTDELTQQFTVCTYDRRGRGDSGDTEPFSPEREYDDLAAVAAAATSGTNDRSFVFGHSSGAAIALRAAAAAVPFAGVVAYEAPFGNEDTPQPSVDPAEHIRELVRTGQRGEAVMFWMRDVVRLPAEVVGQMEGAPWVKGMEALTPTLPYDIAVTDGGIPVAELARIAVPVLVLGGKNSPAWFQRSVADQAAAIPGGQLVMIDGYDHNAPPEVITPILTEFFRRQ